MIYLISKNHFLRKKVVFTHSILVDILIDPFDMDEDEDNEIEVEFLTLKVNVFENNVTFTDYIKYSRTLKPQEFKNSLRWIDDVLRRSLRDLFWLLINEKDGIVSNKYIKMILKKLNKYSNFPLTEIRLKRCSTKYFFL